jgi:hypothetical protein
VAGAEVAGAAVAGATVGASVEVAGPQALRARLAATRIASKLNTNLDFIIFSSKLDYMGWCTIGKIIYPDKSVFGINHLLYSEWISKIPTAIYF